MWSLWNLCIILLLIGKLFLIIIVFAIIYIHLTVNTPQINLYDTNPKLVNYRISLINEETEELNDAIKNKNFVGGQFYKDISKFGYFKNL